ncbi:MAG: hypothetical protein KIG59_00690 [Muribaculaceae bacterium]|nr:hypothetical protein [Muribaculaceae bacterium]
MHDFFYFDEKRKHWEKLLSASIIVLDLPMRIAYPLDDAKIRKIKDLVVKSRNDLLNINRLGVKAVDEIEHCLDRIGLSLGMDIEKAADY